MNEEAMRKHYEATPKKTLINILISSREKVDKLQNRNKERKQEIERLNNIINELEKNKDEIITKYKEEIKRIYNYEDDNEQAHCIRDSIYNKIVEELGYKEIADLLEKAEDDIGFWYA